MGGLPGGNENTDGRRMVDGLPVGAGLRRVRGRPYDAMHQLTGGDAIIFFIQL